MGRRRYVRRWRAVWTGADGRRRGWSSSTRLDSRRCAAEMQTHDDLQQGRPGQGSGRPRGRHWGRLVARDCYQCFAMLIDELPGQKGCGSLTCSAPHIPEIWGRPESLPVNAMGKIIRTGLSDVLRSSSA
jgi:hypothetical protein